MADLTPKLLEKADPLKQESLQSENVPDEMDAEQTWPTPEELAEAESAQSETESRKKVVKKVPKGTSEYQACWILDDESGKEGSGSESESEDEEEGGEGFEPMDGDDEEVSDTDNATIADDTESISIAGGKEGYDNHLDLEEEKASLVRFREERMDQMFPDEIDTPLDQSARKRFASLAVAIKRHPGYTNPIKSKERLVFHIGYRRFSACPIFSAHTNGDKHKPPLSRAERRHWARFEVCACFCDVRVSRRTVSLFVPVVFHAIRCLELSSETIDARLSESPIARTDTSRPDFFFLWFGSAGNWLSVCVRLLLRSCVFLDGPCLYFVPVVFPRDRDAWRLSSETIDATSFWKPRRRLQVHRRQRSWSRGRTLWTLPGTSTDDTVGPSSTSETLRVDAAYYSTAEQAQRVERSAQTKTVLSGKSATQRKFDLLGVSAECQTGDAGTDFLLPQDEGYTDWLATHECQRNIECNSGRMEVEAALTMFQRSWAKHGLRYTTVLSDGDSRTFHALSEAEVYGFIQIDKKDCINHVHKRMGAALRNLVDKKKAQGSLVRVLCLVPIQIELSSNGPSWSGHPFKINRKSAVVRYMFFDRDDIMWFKPVELKTKYGRRGHIKEALGTHGHMKCVFNGQLKSQDTVLMHLYKRMFPKWTYDPEVGKPAPYYEGHDGEECKALSLME
ncbi:hypothetical protein HPB52_007759 [Rhipicephalus sanguineus]|uniref:Pre-rRNA-processing protein TSR1 homolog n=1 Tax=Rhipicephalus sanguineus TaxID=34632 RepID=A0A9D4PLZ0_RHISA|nr:hypothetical protein HPB52_007759 [Rhipicephalus sanguineus]